MEKWTEIRRRVLVEGTSKRQIQRETGLSWPTLEKVLTYSRPPGYRRTKPYPKPKIGPYLDRIVQIIEVDKEVPRKQRHTAKRIFERIREEGYEGGYTQVKEAVRAFRRTKREVFVPLIHRPGEAQVDFGQALGVMRASRGVLLPFLLLHGLQAATTFFHTLLPPRLTGTMWSTVAL